MLNATKKKKRKRSK